MVADYISFIVEDGAEGVDSLFAQAAAAFTKSFTKPSGATRLDGTVVELAASAEAPSG